MKRRKSRFEKSKTAKRATAADGRNEPSVSGILSMSANGFGFVKAEKTGIEYFIPPQYVGNALHRDRVEIVRIEDDRGESRRNSSRGPVARVKSVIEPGRSRLVGERIAGNKVRPLGKAYPDDIRIVGNTKGANRGDWVELELIRGESQRQTTKGMVHSVIGKSGVLENDLQAVIEEYGLHRPYTAEEEEAASRIRPMQLERADLTDRFCVTIDPEDAKDRDDAVSIGPGPDPSTWELGVHISDVAAWISPGSLFDRQAMARSFTAYLPGKTMPMLPKGLTARLSLGGTEDFAHSVLMIVERETGNILETRRCHSRIRVRANLNFDQVDAFLNGNAPNGWDDSFCTNMHELIRNVQTMRLFRSRSEQFLELATSEVRVLCEESPLVIKGLKREVQSESDRLVEECMLAANAAVAREMVEKGIPALFRIHDEPSPEKLEEFSAFLQQTFNLSSGDLSTRSACNRFLGSLPDDHVKPVIVNHFLRALPRACYSGESRIHFGLGKGRYLHFTSPIRRYPDLVVHQQLLAADTQGALRSRKTMEKLAVDTSEREVRNDEAYYAANDRLKLHYLREVTADDPGAMHEAVITKATSTGMLVDIPELGIFGFVPKEYLGDEMHRKSGRFIPERGHRNYSCGDFLFVRLDQVDLIKGRAIFRPIV